jgi:hypothetical protein
MDMTDNQPNDDILDERIRALTAARYNAPEGSVPRDAMWAQIAAARRAARTIAPSEPAEADGVLPLVPRRRSTIVVWRWGAALAAGLILGVVIDRQFFAGDTKPTNVAVSGDTATNRSAITPIDGARVPDSAMPNPSSPLVPQPRNVMPGAGARGAAPQYAVIDSNHGASSSPEGRDSLAQTLYRTAAIQTLVQAEALLTSYRGAESGARDPQAMQQAARWARDVLSSTRLLIDSPAGRDPQMRSLFTDLELVLAQIVQLSGTPLLAGERELIERAMRERDLLPRLRSAVPAGLAAS